MTILSRCSFGYLCWPFHLRFFYRAKVYRPSRLKGAAGHAPPSPDAHGANPECESHVHLAVAPGARQVGVGELPDTRTSAAEVANARHFDAFALGLRRDRSA